MFNKLMDYANKKEDARVPRRGRHRPDDRVHGAHGLPTISYNTGNALDTGFQAILFATPKTKFCTPFR